MERGKPHKMEWVRWLLGVGVLTPLLLVNGCTRGFYRKQADKEVHAILAEKDRYPQWKIENYHVYPNPRARFADAGSLDRPPMPPDDPAARQSAPNPQRPGKAGVAWVEGTGYLSLLEHWDAQNRAEKEWEERGKSGDIQQAAHFHGRHKGHDGDNHFSTPVEMPAGPVAPFLLRLDQAVELGLVNSREYQTRREDLFLAALPVTLERFSFNTQFFAFEEAFRQRSAGQSVDGYGNFWQANTTLGFSKLFSTGALLLASVANQTVVNLTGNDRHTVSSSIANLDFIQPLLRGGGRAVTLEPLTLVERNMLYEVRSYARFRKEFFQYVSGGGDLFELGSTGGIRATALAIGGLTLGTGNPASLLIRPSAAGRLDLAVDSRAASEGFLPNLLRSAILRNEQKNVLALEGIYSYFKLIEEVGDVSSLQVGQVEQDLLRGRSTVLQREQELRDGTDRFKLQLGIPMTVPLQLDDQATRPVSRHLAQFEEIINQTESIIKEMTSYDTRTEALKLRPKLRKLLLESPFILKTDVFRRSFPMRWDEWEKLTDKAIVERLDAARKERRGLLDMKSEREQKGQELPEEARKRFEQLDRETGLAELEYALRRYEREPWNGIAKAADKAAAHVAGFRDVRIAFTLVLGEAGSERLNQVRESWPRLPALVVDGVDLLDSDLERAYETVVRTALANRLDLMNARARLVDSWRQLAIFANSLLGTFNVGYHVDSITPPGQAKPLAFSGSRTRHQLFFNADLPLVRIAERNAYRASLIAYERSRRDLMAVEDAIAAQVRQELRQLRVLSETYRIQQRTVELAYTQVESSLETFRAPPEPRPAGGGGGSTAGNQAALTQQLLNAQRSLPQAQNQLFTIWVNYQIVRQQIFLDLELMPLDFRGVWIDEYSYREPARSQPDGAGQPLGAPQLEWGTLPAVDPERNRALLLPPS